MPNSKFLLERLQNNSTSNFLPIPLRRFFILCRSIAVLFGFIHDRYIHGKLMINVLENIGDNKLTKRDADEPGLFKTKIIARHGKCDEGYFGRMRCSYETVPPTFGRNICTRKKVHNSRSG